VTAIVVAAGPAEARAIAGSAPDVRDEGSLRAALFPEGRKLAIEAAIIAGLIAIAAFAAWKVTHHPIVNRRPLGGANTAVGALQFNQSQMSFAAAGARRLVGASSDAGLETLDVYSSSDAGASWHRTDGPVVPGSCAQGSPQAASLAGGGQVLAFLAAPICGKIQSLTPFLVVSRRPGATAQWSRIHRVAPSAWEFGFDDGPSLAASGNRMYLAWQRSYDKLEATTVVSSSGDGGRTWSAPVKVSPTLVHPHLATTAVGADETLYVAGIDAKLGLWISASHDDGRTFTAPRSIAKLLANPAAECAQTAGQPLPRELRACEGPDPSLLVAGKELVVVYSDYGVNQTSDVFAVRLDRSLNPLGRVQVNPPDVGKTQQFAPAAGVDVQTGTVWACWYDTMFDPHARRTWYTCAASHDGRRWSAPIAAASTPSDAEDIYGTIFGTGLRTSVVDSHGVAHPFWGDSRRYQDEIDVETAAISEARAFAAAPNKG
jgi:hypothetical protein